MDLVLTDRGVQGEEAVRMRLVNGLAPHGQVLDAAVRLAHELAPALRHQQPPSGPREQPVALHLVIQCSDHLFQNLAHRSLRGKRESQG